MKKAFGKMKGKIVPLILCVALIATGGLSFVYIKNLQGGARVINYAGIVRGATQRLVKKELNHVQDDRLIARLDRILEELSEGGEEFNLVRLEYPQFQKLIKEMRVEWEALKAEIFRYREGESGAALFAGSEHYFELADRTVLAAEQYTETGIRNAKKVLLYMNAVFVLLAGCSALWIFYQEKRQQRLNEAEEENRRKSELLVKRLQEIMVPMNEISELMYISDIETYELLFLNNAGKESFGVKEIAGEKCYQLLQGLNEPCSFCTIPYMGTDKNYTWEHTNLVTKRHYLLKDRLVEWDGRKARLEIAFDITDTVNEKIELQKRLGRDRIMMECIRELYRNHDVDKAAEYMLKQVGELFEADRAYIIRVQGDCFSNTAEWCREGIEPQKDFLQNVPRKEFKVWFAMFENRENLVIENLESLRGTMDVAYDFLKSQDINSLILVPLERCGRLDGLIGLDNPALKSQQSAISFLQTLRYFLMLTISRGEDEKLLSRLSYMDTLTGFYNRNRYIKDIDELAYSRKAVGVAYLDVNGLKEVNDEYGHDAGDRLLKQCAAIIGGVFEKGAFYRIGGDEFVIICTDIGEKEFRRNIADLKARLDAQSCRMAVGERWVGSCEKIQTLLSEADEIMYADKKAFYEKNKTSPRYRHGHNGE